MNTQNSFFTRDNLLKFLLLFLGYLSLAYISYPFSIHYNMVGIVWPATGFAISMLLLTDYRLWPAIAMAAFIADFWISQDTIIGLGCAAAAALTCLSAYFLLRFTRFHLQMKRLSDVLLFVILAGFLAPIPGAIIGAVTTGLSFGFLWSDFFQLTFIWWRSDLIGILIMSPFILSIHKKYFKNWTLIRFIEWAFIYLCLVASLVLFFHILGQKTHHDYYPLAYLPLPILLWVTVRFGQPGAALANLLIAKCTLSCAFGKFGHFREDVFGNPLLMTWIFTGMLSVASLILASVLEKQRTIATKNRQKVHFFRQIIDALPTPVCVKDEEGQLLFANRNWSRWEITSPPMHKQNVATEISFKNGTALHTQTKIILDPPNQLLLEQWQDITALKKIIKELEQSVSHLRFALTTAGMGLWSLNTRNHTVSIDYNCRQLIGLPEHCSLAQFQEGIFPEDRLLYNKTLQQTLHNEAIPLFAEFRYRHQDGTTKWLRIKGTAALPQQIIGVLYDISSDRKRQLSLKRAKDSAANSQLTQSVFTINVLYAASQAAYNLIQKVGNFVSSFSDPLSLEQKQLATNLQKNVRKLTKLVENAHELSLAETGKWALQPKTFEIYSLVKETIERAKSKTGNKKIKFHYFIDPTIPIEITVDKNRLERILDNLCRNAIKFIPADEGEIDLTVSLPAGPQQKLLHFSVRDTGIGIAEERLPDLFDASAQIDPKNVDRYGLNTLTLPLCKSLAEQMGGTIWIETEEGKGSSFHLLIAP